MKKALAFASRPICKKLVSFFKSALAIKNLPLDNLKI
jgi:hypothetical protein